MRPRAAPSRGARRSTRSRPMASGRPQRAPPGRPSAGATAASASARVRGEPAADRQAGVVRGGSRAPRRSAPRAAAAAVGVATRTSATSSQRVTSRSWPTADTTGVADGRHRPADGLAVEGHEVLQRAAPARDHDHVDLRHARPGGRSRARSGAGAASPCTGAPTRTTSAGEARPQGRQHVVARGAVGARHQPDAARQHRQGPLALGREQALGAEPPPQLLDPRAQQALARRAPGARRACETSPRARQNSMRPYAWTWSPSRGRCGSRS